MFWPDDPFLTTILKLLGRLSIHPMFGRGLTRLQRWRALLWQDEQGIKLLATDWLRNAPPL